VEDSPASESLQAKLELNFGVHFIRIARQYNWTDKLRRLKQRIACVIFHWVAFEDGIGGEVKLGDKSLVSGGHDQIMDVLADATFVGIVAGDHRFKRIGPRCVHESLSAITIGAQVVVALMVGLPNLDGSVGDDGASSVKDLSRKG
jgi:hypothetical protein